MGASLLVSFGNHSLIQASRRAAIFVGFFRSRCGGRFSNSPLPVQRIGSIWHPNRPYWAGTSLFRSRVKGRVKKVLFFWLAKCGQAKDADAKDNPPRQDSVLRAAVGATTAPQRKGVILGKGTFAPMLVVRVCSTLQRGFSRPALRVDPPGKNHGRSAWAKTRLRRKHLRIGY
ncbi:MAG: hypothetical protein CM15mP120_11310 [Pseudomonadota bacterium]|nr:MAG: hypothetical protein CM15mP120_11310 [Pseudomonadota bacterium]